MYKIIGADQNEYGPVSADDIRCWVRDGRATAQTLAHGEGETDWRPLSSYPEFANLFTLPPRVTPPVSSPGAVPKQKIRNYLLSAIVATVFCCLPTGIVAIFYAAQVDGKISRGDIQGAMESSANAKKWIRISFYGAILLIIAYVALVALGGLF
jgi:hypothetical protein